MEFGQTWYVLGFLFNDMLQQIAVIIFDRVAGVVAGAAVGIAEALVIFLVAYAVAATPAGSPGARSDRAGAADAIQSATFAGLLVHMTPPVHAMLSAVIPNDLATHLSEGTRADTTRA